MNVIIVILAIIGIAVSVLLGLILFVLALMLFMPVVYKIEANNHQELYIKGKVSWLFRIFVCRFYTDKVEMRIFGRTVKTHTQEPQKEISDDDTEDEKEESESVKEEEPEVPEALSSEEEKESTEEKPKEKTLTRLQKFYKKIKNLYDYFKKEKILKLPPKFMKSLYRALKPRIFKLNLKIGLDEPEQTGMALAGLSFLQSKNIVIHGNFEEKMLNFNVLTKGSIFLIRLVLPCIKYLLIPYAKFMIKKPWVEKAEKKVGESRKDKKNERE